MAEATWNGHDLNALESILRDHYLARIECDHDGKRDKPYCQCSLVDLGWHPTVGDAVQAWLDHVMELIRGHRSMTVAMRAAGRYYGTFTVDPELFARNSALPPVAPSRPRKGTRMTEQDAPDTGAKDSIGYVVVEFNQASGQPSVATYSGFGGDVYLTLAEAEDILAHTRAEMAMTVRRETYAIAELREVKSASASSSSGGTE